MVIVVIALVCLLVIVAAVALVARDEAKAQRARGDDLVGRCVVTERELITVREARNQTVKMLETNNTLATVEARHIKALELELAATTANNVAQGKFIETLQKELAANEQAYHELDEDRRQREEYRGVSMRELEQAARNFLKTLEPVPTPSLGSMMTQDFANAGIPLETVFTRDT